MYFIIFFTHKCFVYAIESLSWSPLTKVRITKWKLYLSCWQIIAWKHEETHLWPYIILLYFLALNFEAYHFLFGFSFWFKLCNLFLIDLWYLWLFSYGSCIFWYVFNYKYVIYAIEILSWSPLIIVRCTKWKLYLWYWCIIARGRRYTSLDPIKF